jgi:hypothetical protein
MEAYWGLRPHSSVGTVLPAKLGPQGSERTHMHAPDLRGAQQPSQTGVYKLVQNLLSFRGRTKKSHTEQPPHDVCTNELAH